MSAANVYVILQTHGCARYALNGKSLHINYRQVSPAQLPASYQLELSRKHNEYISLKLFYR